MAKFTIHCELQNDTRINGLVLHFNESDEEEKNIASLVFHEQFPELDEPFRRRMVEALATAIRDQLHDAHLGAQGRQPNYFEQRRVHKVTSAAIKKMMEADGNV